MKKHWNIAKSLGPRIGRIYNSVQLEQNIDVAISLAFKDPTVLRCLFLCDTPKPVIYGSISPFGWNKYQGSVILVGPTIHLNQTEPNSQPYTMQGAKLQTISVFWSFQPRYEVCSKLRINAKYFLPTEIPSSMNSLY